MGYQQDDRQMYSVNLTCADCGTAVNQLPFQPTPGRSVYCSDCLRKKRGSSTGGNQRGGGFQRRMYQVDMKCADCGAQISELPFSPSGDKPVYCSDCNRKRRDQR